MSSTAINVDWLGPREQVGEGGQGTVYRLRFFRLELAWPTLYKEYGDRVTALDDRVLRRLVSVTDRIPDEPRRWLLDNTAWPMALVTRAGQPCGVLMRQVPDAYYLDISGHPAPQRRPAAMEYLLNPAPYVRRLGIVLRNRDRICLLSSLADLLSSLHRAGIVIGDISPTNILFSLDGDPRCFLIDCDTTWLRGDSAVPSAETPDWQAPECADGAPPTVESDIYKYSLMVLRLWAGDQATTDTSRLGKQPVLQALVEQGLDADPARRPSLADWQRAWGRPSAVRGDRLATPAGRPNLRRFARRAVAISVVAAILFYGSILLAHATMDATEAGAAPAPATQSIGVVDVTSVAGDQRAPAVGALLDSFFVAVGSKRPEDAIALFDPVDRLNPIDPGHRNTFLRVYSVDEYRDVRLDRLSTNRPDAGPVTAYVSFVTIEYRPDGAPVCLRWRVTYYLSRSDQGAYRILHENGISRPC